LGLLAGGLAVAQDRPDPAAMIQARIDRIGETVKLTGAQKKQATQIFTDAMTANQTVMASMRESQTALVAAIKANDAAAMEKAANAMGALQAQTTLNNAKAEAAFYATLTPDQQSKYTPGVGGMGRGGFGGGGGRQGGGAPPQE
jgi:Spy/CpxP family protein refolding chaperone